MINQIKFSKNLKI